MNDIRKAVHEKRVSAVLTCKVFFIIFIRLHTVYNHSFINFIQIKEVFGTGTACVVCPVNGILYLDEVRLHF